STRDRIVGIYTTDSVQMIILDTPGLLDPAYPLQRAMRATSLDALGEADVIIHLVDATESAPPDLAAAAGLAVQPRAPIIVAFNKMDALSSNQRAELAARYPSAHQIPAATG